MALVCVEVIVVVRVGIVKRVKVSYNPTSSLPARVCAQQGLDLQIERGQHNMLWAWLCTPFSPHNIKLIIVLLNLG